MFGYCKMGGGDWGRQTDMWPQTVFTDSRPAVPSVCRCCCCLCPRPRCAPWTWTRCRWPRTTGRPNPTPRLIHERTRRHKIYKVVQSLIILRGLVDFSHCPNFTETDVTTMTYFRKLVLYWSFTTSHSRLVKPIADIKWGFWSTYPSNLLSLDHSCSSLPSQSPLHIWVLWRRE